MLCVRIALCALLLAACGDKSPVAQTSTGVATRKPGAAADRKTATIASRNAPVPKWTDKRERLVFVKAGSVWMMKPDGSDATQLTVRSHDAADAEPAFSPTGDRVAYVSPKKGTHKIFAISLQDMIPKEITDGADDGDGEPAWSPDGSKLVFMRGDPRDRRDLMMVDANGGTPVTLLEGNDYEPRYAGSPSWSPDGRLIVFASDRRQPKGTLLWLYDIKTKRLRRLTPSRPGASYLRDIDPSWSKDGKKIVFASNRHANSKDHAEELDIYVINADGSGLTRLTDRKMPAVQPAFSPDGKRIFFTVQRSREKLYEKELYVMAATGGKQVRLTRDETPQNSAPSPGLAK